MSNRRGRKADFMHTPRQTSLLIDTNATHTMVHRLFEEQAELRPTHHAVIADNYQSSYAELNARANQLAHYLRTLGVQPEVLVGVCMERSLDMIVAMLAILKAGGAYVPLDPTYPLERLTFMFEDAELSILLTRQQLQASLSGHCKHLLCLDSDWHTIAQESAENLTIDVIPSHLAYVIYTSGSTGLPKGVQISHGSLLNLVSWHQETYKINATDRATQIASIGFDACVWELWPHLTAGASVYIVDEETRISAPRLLKWLREQQITISFLPTPLAEAVLQLDWVPDMALQTMLTGGDRLVRYPSLTLPCTLLNHYGPTEATVLATYALITPRNLERDEEIAAPPIGRPIPNTQVYILDSELAPLPVGEAGELYISGAGLARGYLKRADLTAEKFLPDPFSREPGTIMYRTGDLARYLADGNIEYLGRTDQQVKVHGFRIELGEIETALGQHPMVQACSVVAREALPGSKHLVAYIVLNQEIVVENNAANDWQNDHSRALRKFLANKLPEYMVPAACVFLDELPITPNGKVDRRVLLTSANMAQRYTAPRTRLEELIANLWMELLGLTQVSIHENFFTLGGHSLLATQVVSRIRQVLQIDLGIRSLFTSPTIAELAESIETIKDQKEQVPPIKPFKRLEQSGQMLSFAQQRLWFLNQWAPESPLYNVFKAFRLAGPLNISLLEQCLNKIIRRHEALRTRFVAVDGTPQQTIDAELILQIQRFDFCGIPDELRDAAAFEQMKTLIVRPFDLATGPLVRVTVCKLAAQVHILLIEMHHSISDGWSMAIFLQELATRYDGHSKGDSLPPAPLDIQYADFALWQRQWLQGNVLASQLAHWQTRLRNMPAPLALPTDRTRPPVQSFKGSIFAFHLPQTLSTQLEQLCQQEGVTLYMCLLAVFKVLLYRYSGQDDLVVGTPIANRNHAEIENLIGFFVNTLVLRTNLSGNPRFQALLQRVRAVALDAYEYQDIPFEYLVEILQPERNISYVPLFQVMFVLQIPAIKFPLTTLAPTPILCDNDTAQFDLTLIVEETEQGLQGILEYNTDLFDCTTIQRMAQHWQQLLESAVAHPEQHIGQLPMLSAGEREEIVYTRNATLAHYSRQHCIHELIEVQAVQTPENIAVIADEQQLSYREFNQRANQLAHYLRKLGVGPDVLVGIYMDRSLETMVAILGVLKAGGAYVPLDVTYPAERLAFMLEDTRAAVLLTQRHLLTSASSISTTDTQILCLAENWPMIASESQENPAHITHPAHLAYVIYTSGSTGKPKGTLIAHQEVVNHNKAVMKHFALQSRDRILQFSSLSFDIAIEELFPSWIAGATVVLRPEEIVSSMQDFLYWTALKAITVLNMPTAYWHMLVQELASTHTSLSETIRLVVVGGEKVQLQDYLTWLRASHGHIRWLNAYGPTETTVTATIYEPATVMSEQMTIPIGKPIANVQGYVLDQHGLPVPVGVPGELYIGGAGVARGYLHRPDLTAERFIPDAFSGFPGARLYKTGDRACHMSDGNIAYLGRADQQIKLRGFRIEPGEIEACLNLYPSVHESVVLAREHHAGDMYLAAYVVAAQTLSLQQLRNFLKERLPVYMLPDAFVLLDALPLTASGKVDRYALPVPNREESGLAETGQASLTPMEELLLSIWRSVLGIERIAVEDNFFILGGHSLLAMQLISRINRVCNVMLPVRDLFKAPTIATLGKKIEELRRNERSLPQSPIQTITRQAQSHYPLSFAQQRLWFLNQLEPDSSTYNLPCPFRLRGTLHVEALRLALNTIVQRHEILRTTFVTIDYTPFQCIAPALLLELPIQDLPVNAELATIVQERIDKEAALPFDLAQGPLLRASLLKVSAEEHILLLTLHHIVSDGWSMDIFFRELTTLYKAFIVAPTQQSPLADLPIQYADFALWQRQWLQGEALEEQLTYWRKQLGGHLPILEMPTDYPRPIVQTYCGARHSLILSPTLSGALKQLSKQEYVTLFMLFLAAFQVLLHRYTGQEDILVGTPTAHRNREESEHLIGFFVNTLVLRVDLSGNPTFQELASRVREVALEAYDHQDLPFDRLVEALQPERDQSRNPLFQVMFNMASFQGESVELPGLTLENLLPLELQSKFDMTLYAGEQEQNIRFDILYNSDLFTAERMQELLAQLELLLEQIVDQPTTRINRFNLVTPRAKEKLPDPQCTLSNDWYGSVLERFLQHVRAVPERPAVIDAAETWSYSALDARSNQLANYLRSLNTAPGSVIAIYAHRSAALIWALLAVHKACGAFLLLDPTYPTDRLIACIQQAQPQVCLQIEAAGVLPTALKEYLASQACQLLVLSGQATEFDPLQAYAQTYTYDGGPVKPDDIAYIAFTSGSTGRPKGILGTHGPLSHFLSWYSQTFTLVEMEQFCLLSGLSHDPLLRDILTPLWLGATLHIPQQDDILVPDRLADWLEQKRISVIHLTPALGQLLALAKPEEGPGRMLSALRFAFFGGDVLTHQIISTLHELAPGVECINFYGATETPQAMGYYRVPMSGGQRGERIPLGQGIRDTQILVLNSAQQLAGVSEIGEIYIRTPYLARGYLQDEMLTQNRFVINPFTHLPGDRLYATGDLGRYLPDGNVVFAGRNDQQVKIRGFRVELEEIEVLLSQHPAVHQCKVVDLEYAPDDKRIVAYLVSNTEPLNELRAFLRQKLPEYMLPYTFVMVAHIPLTSNGKLDRSALPMPDWATSLQQENAFVAPRTALEEALTGIWAGVLHVPKVGIYDNFFLLGGHSLIATRLLSYIRSVFHVDITLRHLFTSPTVAGLAQVIQQQEQNTEARSFQTIEKAAEDQLADVDQLPDELLEVFLASIENNEEITE